MSAAVLTNRRLVLGLAAVGYAGVFSAFVTFEHSGLGLGHFFYVPICLVALVTSAPWGAAAGAFGAGLYAAGAVAAPGIPATQVLTEATAIRLVTYTLVGALVGRYASSNRALVARLHVHATHDFLTGLGNARVFDERLAHRCATAEPFTVVLADLDDLKRINDAHGHEAGNAALRVVAKALRADAGPLDDVARIGGDEFAILSPMPLEEAPLLCARIRRTLAADDLQVSFGVTTFPQDGTTAVELFRKADDRLFAAKLVARNRRTVVALG